MWHKTTLGKLLFHLRNGYIATLKSLKLNRNQVMQRKVYWTNQHKMKKNMLFDGFILETKWKYQGTRII